MLQRIKCGIHPEKAATLYCKSLFREAPDDLGRDVQEEDGGNEREREDENNEWVNPEAG